MNVLSLIAIAFLTQESDLSAYAERAGLPEIERWALAEAWKESAGRERERAANRFAGVLANAFLTHPERAAEFRMEAEPLIEALPSSSPARLRLEIELLAAQALPVEQSASSALCSFEPVDVDQIAIALTDVLDNLKSYFSVQTQDLSQQPTGHSEPTVKRSEHVCLNQAEFLRTHELAPLCLQVGLELFEYCWVFRKIQQWIKPRD